MHSLYMWQQTAGKHFQQHCHPSWHFALSSQCQDMQKHRNCLPMLQTSGVSQYMIRLNVILL